VQWEEQAGGKVSMLRDGSKMLRQLWKIRKRIRGRRQSSFKGVIRQADELA
jgi:hypothetical protein